MSTAAVKRYWDLLVQHGCLICGGPAEVAHCHGGSIVERLQEPKAKGKKLGYMDFLVLPLCPPHGRAEYPEGLDRDVAAWEGKYGRQADWLDLMIHRTGIDCWAKARALMKAPLPRRAA